MAKHRMFIPYPDLLGRKPSADQIMNHCRRLYRQIGPDFIQQHTFLGPFTYWLWIKLGRRTIFIDSEGLADNLIQSKISTLGAPCPSRLFGKCYAVAAVKRVDGTSVFPPFIVLNHKGDTYKEIGIYNFAEAVVGQRVDVQPDQHEDMKGLILYHFFDGPHEGGSGLAQTRASQWNETYNNDAAFNEFMGAPLDGQRRPGRLDTNNHTKVGRLISSICAYYSAFPDRLIDGPPADITSPEKNASYKTIGPPPPTGRERGGTHTSPDAHYRRWHFRELRNDRFERNADGTPKVVLVRDCYVKPDSAKTLIGHSPSPSNQTKGT